MRRLLALTFVAAGLAGGATASHADDANRECDNNEDITVVVDFKSLGGGVNVRCAPQPVKNGFDAFRRANISYETVTNSDFVCRIADKPGTDAEDCENTPPANAYWSYWTATRGGAWKYQSYGPGARKPPAGSFEGWAFVTDDKSPPRYPVPQPATAPTTTTTAADANQPPTPTTTRARSSRVSAVTTPHTSPPSIATTAADVADTTTSQSTSTTAVALGRVDLSRRGGDGGTSVGFILSALAVVALGAFGIAFTRRRAV